jgi:hypothetical protein
MTTNIINDSIIIQWTEAHEEILVDWADKAMCYRWLHSKNYERYNRFNILFTIPVIIMSTVTGTANFAQDKIPLDLRSYYSMIIGGINILAGIITTIQNFLKISQINEAHRVSAISWDKFYRKIKVELAKTPNERQSVEIYLKNCTEEYDRLMETSPAIDKKIIIKFKQTFQGKVIKDKNGNDILNENQKTFKELSKPEICDSLESVRKSVYREKPKKEILLIKNDTTVDNKINNNANKILNSAFTEVVKRKKELTEKEKILDSFSSDFYEKYSRYPTEEEILENLDENNFSKDIISTWTYKQNKLNNNENEIKNNKVLGENNV